MRDRKKGFVIKMKLTDAEWIFFDLGSTLVDETEAHNIRAEAALSLLEEETGKKHTLEEFNELAYRFGTEGRKAPSPSALRYLGVKKFDKYNKTFEIAYENSAPVLARLHKKYKIGIIANQSGGTVRRMLRMGILDNIDLVYSSAEMGMSKPSVEFFRSALKAAECSPERSVMVGDRLDNDIFPAKKAGMMAVRLRQGFYRGMEIPATEETPAPDADIGDLSDLPDLFGC